MEAKIGKPEIKACPCCEHDTISLEKQRILFDDVSGEYVRYQCDYCGVTTEGCLYETDALTLWNALPRMELAEKIADEQGCEVTKRKPEIKACPVCEKFNVDGKRTTESKFGNIVHHVVCNNCGITISKLSRNEAIEAWNALPRKGE